MAARDQAVKPFIAALRDLALLGVGTNIDYLARVLDHPAFRAGDLSTAFVARHAADLAQPAPDTATLDRVLIAAALADHHFARLIDNVPEPYASMGQWRN